MNKSFEENLDVLYNMGHTELSKSAIRQLRSRIFKVLNILPNEKSSNILKNHLIDQETFNYINRGVQLLETIKKEHLIDALNSYPVYFIEFALIVQALDHYFNASVIQLANRLDVTKTIALLNRYPAEKIIDLSKSIKYISNNKDFNENYELIHQLANVQNIMPFAKLIHETFIMLVRVFTE